MKKHEIQFILEKNARILYFDRSSTLEELDKIKTYMHLFNPGYEIFRQAIMASVMKDIPKALVLCDEALNIAFINNDVFLIQEVSMFKGVINRSIGAQEDALMNYITALKYGQSPRAYNNIADIYISIGDYGEAKIYLEKALAILTSKEDLNLFEERLLNIVYTNLSEADLKSNNVEDGIISARKCIEMAENLKDIFTEAFGYTLLGTAAMMNKNYPAALEFFEYSLELYTGCDTLSQNRVFDYIEENIFCIAECYYEWGRLEAALETLEKLTNKSEREYDLLMKIYSQSKDEKGLARVNQAYIAHIKQEETLRREHVIDHYRTKLKVFETEKRASDYELLYNHTKSVSQIGKDIIAAERLDDVLKAIYTHIDNIMDFNSLALAVVDDQTICYNWVLENNQQMAGFEVDVNNRNSFSSWVVRNKKSIRINDALTIEELSKYKEEAGTMVYGDAMDSMILCPIIHKDKVYGLINVQSDASYTYTEYDLEVINMLTSFIAIAMKNWRDTALLREANDKLERLSKTDALTGISNRHVLSEMVENLFKKEDEDSTISVVMIDIDHFKEYNDTYGHIDGDRCIVKIVDVLRKHLDVGNFRLFRYGGDEFVSILPYVVADEVHDILERTRYEIENLQIPNIRSSVSDFVTCTFGYTTVSKGDMGYQKVFYVADKALYSAKANGKNCIVLKEG